MDTSLDRNTCFIPRTSLCKIRKCFNIFYQDYDSPDYDMYFMNCALPVNSSLYVDYSPCVGNSSSAQIYMYAFIGSLNVSDLPKSCSIEATTRTRLSNATGLSVLDIHQELLQRFGSGFTYYYEEGCFEDKYKW